MYHGQLSDMSDQAKVMDSVTFSDWAEAHGLTANTLDLLAAEEILDFQSVKCLREEDLKALGLSVGQRAKLRAAVANLTASASVSISKAPTSLETPDHPVGAAGSFHQATTKSLAQDAELNKLINELKDTHLTDLLGVSNQAPAASGKKGERSLLIPDFVTTVKWGYRDEEDTILSPDAKAGSHLVIRSKRKLSPEQVSLPQWIGASARILLHLIANDKVNTMDQAKDYIEYMAQIGDLCQTYTVSSVMTMDDAHRRQVAGSTSRMLPVGMHTMFFHLEKRSGPPSSLKVKNKQADSRSRRTLDSRGNEICIKYNQTGGCTFTQCRYSHICLTPGCEGDHPQFRHDTIAPRFRGRQGHNSTTD